MSKVLSFSSPPHHNIINTFYWWANSKTPGINQYKIKNNSISFWKTPPPPRHPLLWNVRKFWRLGWPFILAIFFGDEQENIYLSLYAKKNDYNRRLADYLWLTISWLMSLIMITGHSPSIHPASSLAEYMGG